MIKVSIVIPVYNAGLHLRECLDSVCSQTLSDIEIICVDDGSSDNSLSILKEYEERDSRFIILHQKNKHAGAARNAGAQVATGETIAFLDADDWVEAECYEKLYNKLVENDAEVSACFHVWFNENNEIVSYNGKVPWDDKTCGIVNIKDYSKYLMYRRFVAWDKLYKMDFYRKNNLHFSELLCSNDRSFYIQMILSAKRIYVFDEYLVHYRTSNPNSISFNSTIDNFKCRLKAFEECWKLVDNCSFKVKRMLLDITLKDFLYPYSRAQGELKREINDLLLDYIKGMDLFYFGKGINTYNWYPQISEIVGELSKDECEALQLIKENHGKRRGLNIEDSRKKSIIISFTSFPARIETVYLILEDMLNQTVRPDKIIVWLAEEQFPDRKLPIWESYYKKQGIEFRFCKEDLRGHKKYFYAMQEFPDDIIITIDDDIRYKTDFVETLFAMHKIYPNAVVCRRAHQILFNDQGRIEPYNNWNKQYNEYIGYPRMDLCATGVCGCLYPPKCLDFRYLQKDMIISMCLGTDDLWLKVMEVLNGTPTVLAESEQVLEYIDGTQEYSLYNENAKNHANGNDIALQSICSIYGEEFIKKVREWSFSGQLTKELVLFLSARIAESEKEKNSAAKRSRINRRKLEKSENELSKLQAENSHLKERIEKEKIKYVSLEKDYKKSKKQLKTLKLVEKDYALLKNSTTYKIGRIIMYIPCRIKDYFIRKMTRKGKE